MITFALFAIGIILIAFVMIFFGFKEVVDVITTARVDYIMLAVALQVAILLLLALRLILLSRKYRHLGFVDAFKISMSGMAVSMITPIAKIGGEPLKIYLLKKQKFTGSEATAVIAVDTLAELASSLFVVFLVFVIFARNIPVFFNSFVAFLVIIAVLITGLLYLLLNLAWMRKLVNWTTKRISKFTHIKKKNYAELFYNAFKILIKDKKVVVSAFSVSFITKILEFARMWLVFAAISMFLPAEVIVIVWSVILILYLVPWLPGSLGLVEFFGTGTLVFFGLTSSIAVGGLLLDRFVSYWLVLVLGLLITTTISLPKRLKK